MRLQLVDRFGRVEGGGDWPVSVAPPAVTPAPVPAPVATPGSPPPQ